MKKQHRIGAVKYCTLHHIILPVILAVTTNGHSQNLPPSPVFAATYQDAVTGTNKFTDGGNRRWTVSSGADNYSIDQYERPTNQTYGNFAGRYATDGDYFGNLDIVSGQAGADNTYLFFAIDLYSTNLEPKSGSIKNEGLAYEYNIRLSQNASGAGGYLFNTKSPSNAGTTWQTQKNFAYFDQNQDLATDGNGFETVVVSDGMLNNQSVFFTRLRPGDASVVEFALKSSAFNLSASQISYLVFEANKGLQDPANYLWNKEYTPSEAGSPNPGTGGRSEFGTQGLGNIYELDTLRGGAIPEPTTALLGGIGLLLMFRRRR